MTTNHATIERLLGESDWLRNLARKLVSNPADADDLAQETIAVALSRPPSEDRPLRPWLATVAKNLTITKRRKRAAQAARETEFEAARPAPERPEQILRDTEIQEQLLGLVRELRAEERDAILLRYHEGWTAVQIGDELGISPDTVRSRLKRGLDKLRGRLDETCEGGRNEWLAAMTPFALRSRTSEFGGTAFAGGTWLVTTVKVAVIAIVLSGIGVGAWSTRTGESQSANDDRSGSLADVVVRDVATTSGARPTDVPVQAIRTAETSGRSAASADAALPELGPVVATPLTRLVMRAVDETGAPVPNASARLLPGARAVEAILEQAGELNEFERLAALASLRQSSDGNGHIEYRSTLLAIDAMIEVEVDGPDHAHFEGRVDLRPGEDYDLGDIVLVPRARVFGTLVSRDGNVVLGNVELTPQTAGDLHGRATDAVSSTTSEDGSFEVFATEPGTYRLLASALNEQEPSFESEPFDLALGSSFEVSPVVSALKNSIVLRAIGESNTPLAARFEYAFIKADGSRALSGTTGAGPDGEAVLRGPLHKFESLEVDVIPTSGVHGRRHVSIDTPFDDRTITFAKLDVVRRAIRVEPGAGQTSNTYARFSAFGAFGQPAADDQRAARNASARTFTCEVPLAPASDYTLTIAADDMQPIVIDHAQLLALPDSSEVTLAPWPRVEGRVVEAGSPIGGARISISVLGDPTTWLRHRGGIQSVMWMTGNTARTDREGRFSIPERVLDSPHLIEVSARGFAPTIIEASRLTPTDDQAPAAIELVRPGTVTGVVRDSDGLPRRRALVVASHPRHRVVRGKTDRQGRYRLELAPGEWTVALPHSDVGDSSSWEGLSLPDDWALPGGVTVASGVTTDHDLRPISTKPLVVRVAIDGVPAAGARIRVAVPHRDPLREFEPVSTVLDDEGQTEVNCPTERDVEIRLMSQAFDGAPVLTVEPAGVDEFTRWSLGVSQLTILGQPGESVGVRTSFAGGSAVRFVNLNEDGQAVLRFPAGSLELQTGDGTWSGAGSLRSGEQSIDVR